MSPWAKIAAPEAASLQDIMSEEVARDLQAKEDKKNADSTNPTKELGECDISQETIDQIAVECVEDEDSDFVIVQMLQKQFDQEYDDMIKRTKDKFNRTSKVSISFSNYRRTPQNLDPESDSEEEEELEDLRDRKDWDLFEPVLREARAMPPCGYVVEDGHVITKHKFMSFPPEFQTGDEADFDLKLSNKVVNSLKFYSKDEQNRWHKLHDKKDHAPAEFGMDEYTRLLLYKMINRQLLERVNGVLSIGKEAVILHADTDPSYPDAPLPKECVMKVFKFTFVEFKNHEKYISDDFRFKHSIGKQDIRRTINLWAEKEMHNLYRMQKAGIPCPEVIALRRHILVMSFIGQNHRPAPRLKDVTLTPDEWILAYDQVVELMKILFEKARLIHADLSEYNILWHNQQCYFIDVSQSTEPRHQNDFHFLYRDCEKVTNFFQHKDVPLLKTPDELFIYITGCDFKNKIDLETFTSSFKIKPHLVDKPGMESNDLLEATWQEMQAGQLRIAKNAAIEAENLTS